MARPHLQDAAALERIVKQLIIEPDGWPCTFAVIVGISDAQDYLADEGMLRGDE